MRKSGWRLALSAALFAGWIGYLAYLSATTTHPIVLSRPQFLAADFYVVAEVPADPAAPDEPASVVTVKQVVWSARSEDSKLTAIEVLNLNAKHGWEGAGEYIMPLCDLHSTNSGFRRRRWPHLSGNSDDTTAAGAVE
jgi:hypothetical protein